MPPQTNTFQQAVAYIAQRLAPSGATVRESVMVPEKGIDGVTREVDTLIEGDFGFSRIRVAVESRDRSRKDSVEWVDCLIGKYSNLDVDQVVGVSSQGFSAAAKKKAELNRIILLSLDEVPVTDWDTRFIKLGVAKLRCHVTLKAHIFETEPPLSKVVSGDQFLSSDRGPPGEQLTAQKMVQDLLPDALAAAQEYWKQNAMSLYKTLADYDNEVDLFSTYDLKGCSMVVDELPHQVNRLVMKFGCRVEREIVEVEHGLVKDAVISSATMNFTDRAVSMTMGQIAGNAEVKVFLESKEAKKSGK